MPALSIIDPSTIFTIEKSLGGNVPKLASQQISIYFSGMKKQMNFSFMSKLKLVHGGEHARQKRKEARPLRLNKPIHLVLRAKRAGLKMRTRRIQTILKKYGERFHVKIYHISINSNHIHLIISTPKRLNFQHFLRSITGLIAKCMGPGKLWLHLAFSRVASWGKEYQILVSYIKKNQLETAGLISYQVRSG